MEKTKKNYDSIGTQQYDGEGNMYHTFLKNKV